MTGLVGLSPGKQLTHSYDVPYYFGFDSISLIKVDDRNAFISVDKNKDTSKKRVKQRIRVDKQGMTNIKQHNQTI